MEINKSIAPEVIEHIIERLLRYAKDTEAELKKKQGKRILSGKGIGVYRGI